jgi:hypothetical protein
MAKVYSILRASSFLTVIKPVMHSMIGFLEGSLCLTSLCTEGLCGRVLVVQLPLPP